MGCYTQTIDTKLDCSETCIQNQNHWRLVFVVASIALQSHQWVSPYHTQG